MNVMNTQTLVDESGELRPKWGWFLALGIALLLLGAVAMIVPWLTTLTSVLVFGWLLVFGGVLEVIAVFWARGWPSIVLHLLGGILSTVVGALVVAHPDAGALGLTLLLATLFLAGGLFRVGAAVVLRLPNWGWAVAGGIVTALLGVAIWIMWPFSALWVIGMFVAIELMFRGWAWVMFAGAAREISKAARPL
ncbi:MAG: HdeD family acid-resistance protein [Acidobacteria bacterium]|nr:MAG: HdeD family acid-resistance protein [Acidobacteriota bacterium]